MADLKARATDTSGDGTRKLPVAEKAARLRDQELRLPEVRIRGELQPSYALVDMMAQMKEKLCGMDTTIKVQQKRFRDSEQPQRQAGDFDTGTTDGEAVVGK